MDQTRKDGHRRAPSVGGGKQPIRQGAPFDFFLVLGIPLTSTFKHAHINGMRTAASISRETIPEEHDSLTNGDVIKQNDKENSLPFTASGSNGANGDDSTIQPTILYQFPPSDKALPFEVVPFCFPNRAFLQKISTSHYQGEVNRVLCRQLRLLEFTENSFVFLLVSDENVYYVTCVVNEELLERKPSFISTKRSLDNVIDSFQRRKISENSKNRTGSITRRVYCFVSKFPFFKCHFSVLYSILARERLYALEEQSADDVFSHSLDSLKTLLEENEVLSLVRSYYNQKVPKAGESSVFQLPGELHSLRFECPEGDEDKLLSEWCIPIAFRVLKLEHILLIFSAILLERHVIIVCCDMGVLSAVVLSMIPILRPLVWQGPLIPILPVDMYDYLGAPVPYLVGVLTLPEKMKENLSHALIVNVDTEEITLPNDGITPLLYYNKLETGLKSLHQVLYHSSRTYTSDHHVKYQIEPLKITEDQVDAARKIMVEFSNYHKSVLENIVPHLRAGFQIQKDKVLEAAPKSARTFLTGLLSTQHLEEYMNTLFEALSEEEEQQRTLDSEISKKIRILEEERALLMVQIEAFQIKAKMYQEEINSLKEQQGAKKKKSPVSFQAISNSLDLLRSYTRK